MARTSWESLTLTAAGVAATGEDLGDAATVLLPGANDIPDQRRDVDIVRGGEAAEEERQRVASAKTRLMTRSLRMEMGALSVEVETEGSLLRETAALRAQAEGVVEEGRHGRGEEGGDEMVCVWTRLQRRGGVGWRQALVTGGRRHCARAHMSAALRRKE
uniref:Uncharacterized protein n=1 Tax=Oryza sativa subsp. japonica TaxID=39947 RepID=Q8W5Q5_ORYSJ|nr:hypothetical protein [Oryza sativa Japonica Group]